MGRLLDENDVVDALEKVASFFPYRIPGKGETYDKYNEAWNDAIGRAEMEIESLPSAQPEKTQLSGESTTKDSTFDCISRQQVIDRIEWWFEILKQNPDILIDAIKTLPPTHPEVIRCEDCKYNRECSIQYVAYAGDKFFCGAGERRQNG